MDVSVIIVNYNTCQMTKDCIDSIFSKTEGLSFEIILIDNASTDGSKEHFEKDTRIRYVYSMENMGFGRANNVGMMLAKGEYFFLLNSDTLLLNNAIKDLYDKVIQRCEIAFYGAWLLNNDNEVVHSGAKIPTIGNVIMNIFSIYLEKLKINSSNDTDMTYSYAPIIETEYVTGADLFFHKTIYELIGGFDHNYFMYYEDSDLQRLAKKKGIKSYLINGPRIIHHIGASNTSKHWNGKKFNIEFRSCCYYIIKNYGNTKYIVFRMIYALLYVPLLLFSRSLNIHQKRNAIHILLKGLSSLFVG